MHAQGGDVVQGSMFTLVLSFCLTLAWVGQAMEMEYISPEKRQELEKEFDQALMKSATALSVKQKIWTCDMYGVRTRMQVKRNVKLYRFTNADDWKNSGSQVVSDYRKKDDSLKAENERFEDQLRLTGKGQLISRLSVLKPERAVVAYSVCSAQ